MPHHPSWDNSLTKYREQDEILSNHFNSVINTPLQPCEFIAELHLQDRGIDTAEITLKLIKDFSFYLGLPAFINLWKSVSFLRTMRTF